MTTLNSHMHWSHSPTTPAPGLSSALLNTVKNLTYCAIPYNVQYSPIFPTYLPFCTITLCPMFILYILFILYTVCLHCHWSWLFLNLIVHVYNDNKHILFYSILFSLFSWLYKQTDLKHNLYCITLYICGVPTPFWLQTVFLDLIVLREQNQTL